MQFIVLKGCKEKAQTIPARLDASIQPQLKALENVLEYIFDRNACLLPGYFIVTEIQKAYPDGKNWPHWVCYFKNENYILLSNKILYKFLVETSKIAFKFCRKFS